MGKSLKKKFVNFLKSKKTTEKSKKKKSKSHRIVKKSQKKFKSLVHLFLSDLLTSPPRLYLLSLELIGRSSRSTLCLWWCRRWWFSSSSSSPSSSSSSSSSSFPWKYKMKNIMVIQWKLTFRFLEKYKINKINEYLSGIQIKNKKWIFSQRYLQLFLKYVLPRS